MKAISAMQSSKHIGSIVRNHAEAVENGKAAPRKRRAKGSGSSFASVPKHRAFVPMVTIWGGLFMALIMAVMPDYAVARMSSLTGVYLPLIAARLILAFAVGCAGALLGYIVASALASHAKTKLGDDGLVTKAFKSREPEPINPVADLGSESLDAPIAEGAKTQEPAQDEPTLGELAERGFEFEEPQEFGDEADDEGKWAFTRKHFKDALIDTCESAACEPAGVDELASLREQARGDTKASAETGVRADTGFASLSAEQITPQRKPLNEKRDALDLGSFSALPEASLEAHNEGAEDVPAQPQTPASALEVLRQKPTGELSLVEMVERFAAALHDHQAKERERLEQSQQSRDAALAEALKALTLFTENGFDKAEPAPGAQGRIDETEDELRSALTRLQGLRGAA